MRPKVINSYNKIPKDHTSDFILNFRSNAASGAVHLIGNFVSVKRKQIFLNLTKTVLQKYYVKKYKSNFGRRLEP